MRVFLAGSTGAIGKRLTPLLVAAGHTVTGTTRHPNKTDSIRAAGAIPAVVNALNAAEVLEAVQRAAPDVIIHELTAIPTTFDLRRFDEEFALTNRLRTEGTDNLMDAARKVGCRRLIAQSYAVWPYARTGGWVKTEEDPLISSPEPAIRQSLEAIRHVESAVVDDRTISGVILRYGAFYGPGTSLGEGGSFLEDIRRRRMPIVGNGAGYWSFIHIDDAASATLAAVEANGAGIYNVCDDEPASVSQWLPFLASALGAKAPRHIPAWLGRIVIGRHGVAWMTEIRGASNQKAKSLLRWKPKWPTWRTGFLHGLADETKKTVSQPSLRKAG
jgi:nucleoside-diphosphate-sugar epimerase